MRLGAFPHHFPLFFLSPHPWWAHSHPGVFPVPRSRRLGPCLCTCKLLDYSPPLSGSLAKFWSVTGRFWVICISQVPPPESCNSRPRTGLPTERRTICIRFQTITRKIPERFTKSQKTFSFFIISRGTIRLIQRKQLYFLPHNQMFR